jgi:hypothetical protein
MFAQQAAEGLWQGTNKRIYGELTFNVCIGRYCGKNAKQK